MKNVFLCITMLLFSYSMTYAQRGQIDFNETEHNFGSILEFGGNVSCDFIVTNNSSEPLLINNVTASCGCTTPKWTKEPIKPGKTGIITAEFNPKGHPGAFTKSISVYNSQTTNPLHLRIKGVVIRGNQNSIIPAADLAENYPVNLDNFLLKDKVVNFEQLTPGQSKTIHMEIYNNSGAPMSPAIEKISKYLTVKTTPENIPAHTAATMDVTLNASYLKGYGNVRENFNLVVGKNTYPLSFSALIVDDLSSLSDIEKTKAGKINFSTKAIDLKKSESAILKISNSGKTDLHIKNIQSSDPLVTVSKGQFIVKPNEINEIKVNVARKKMKDAVSSIITVISDDPQNQVQDIIVKSSL